MMRAILQELGGVPNVLYQEGQTAPVTFALSNRFAQVMGTWFLKQLRSLLISFP
jgi:hypothetical protein